MPMARLPITALAVSCVAACLMAPAAGASRAGCSPTTTRVHGHRATIECGPASAIVHFRGATLRYAGGTCRRAGPRFSLEIGTKVGGATSDHFFSLYLPRRAASKYTTSSAVIAVAIKYSSYRWQKGLLTVTPGVTRGAFTGKLKKLPSGASSPFSGSFSCVGSP